MTFIVEIIKFFSYKFTYWNITLAMKIKKKRRMRILSACIFSKSFGGKIRQNWTAVTLTTNESQTNIKLCKNLFILNMR